MDIDDFMSWPYDFDIRYHVPKLEVNHQDHQDLGYGSDMTTIENHDGLNGFDMITVMQQECGFEQPR